MSLEKNLVGRESSRYVNIAKFIFKIFSFAEINNK